MEGFNLWNLLQGAAGALILSAAVRALPKPPEPAVGFWQNFYSWLYRFANLVLANLDKVRNGKTEAGPK
jgi:hypothetical protein